ncbi:peptide/nickel transport system substrate-binding protein [Evansella caseinilytica]|uniref:Peptide/nickel transport system substrate-binding protein n=1 Tax=Evansella caseinilytica TaxID=1503961 RepID=A0A1H3UZ90_9BACI|nr:ABC transporter substrate-binding protein [Evansella caseinilytica]SDZ67291.1 peptide/nickel transport system substrate-binding protein [Evansella caseinilytica]
MKFNKVWLMLVLSLSFVLVLAACGGGDGDTGTDDESANDDNGEETVSGPQSGGTITAGMYSAPGHQFNPLFYSDAYEANILSFTHEQLVQLDQDLQWAPSLAESWEINEDYTEITFTLNDGITWQDGEPFTADDVVFTYETIMDEDYVAAGGVRTSYVVKLDTVEALDPQTVKFTYTESNVNAIFDASFYIVPKHIFGDVPLAEMPDHSASRRAGEVIGTGPYQLTDMLENEQYVLTAYEGYWQGTPYLDGITWRVIEQSVMPGLLESGEIDMIAEPNGVPAADFERVDALDNITTFVTQDFGYQYMGFKLHHRTADDVENGVIDPDNWIENEKLSDVRVRQAIVYAINREGIVNGLLFGMGDVLNAHFPAASWAFDEDAPEKYEYSPETAEALLDDAGYVDQNGDGFREDPDGNEWVLNLDYPTGNQVRERSAPIIVENLEAVGIKVDLRNPREAGPHFDMLEKDNTDWDLYLAGWSLSAADPDPSGIFLSTDAYNYTRWNDPHSDELIKKGVQAPEAFDQDYRREVYAEWAHYVSEQVPQVFLYSNTSNYAYNAKLQNVKEYPSTIYTDSHLWYLEQ